MSSIELAGIAKSWGDSTALHAIDPRIAAGSFCVLQAGALQMKPAQQRLTYNEPGWLDTLAAWVLALLWILPLVYAV